MIKNPIQDDWDLRSRFNELHDEVEASTPPFVARSPRAAPRRPLVWGVAVGGASVALVAAVWLGLRDDKSMLVPGIDLNAVAWTAPSDYLLNTPGREILSTLPSFGVENYTVQSSDPGSGVADTSG